MSSGLCQGLQSCLEPLLVEPLVLRLKLAPPKSNFPRSVGSSPKSCVTDSDPNDPKAKSNNQENSTPITTTTTTTTTNNNYKNNSNDLDTKSQNNVDMHGWSFLQSLSNTSQTVKEAVENEKVYVHPLVKSSSSMLSEKSLEMCTESLGSETGSDASESSDDISLLSIEYGNSPARERSKLGETYTARKIKHVSSFPPPLTSISRSSGVQVKSHREDGRLILKAVTVSSCHTYFHAERSEGRLTLRLLKDCGPDCDNEEDEEEGESVEEDEFEVEEEEEEQVQWEEDMEDNSGNVGGDIGMGKFPRSSRCMEGGRGSKGLLNWEPFWVAT